MHAPKLARYEVLGRLATGGMAEVWLARSLGIAGFEKLVVIKTILPSLAQNPQFVTMFVNEARLAAMLSHPNCVQIFDLGQEGEWLYIAMEYLEGFSLARVLKRAKAKNVKLSDGVVARLIMDAASGLDYSHRLKDREGRPMGLVHRDVSPDNLLVGFSGQVKVVDFGIAKAATPALLASATTAGTVKGKHGYIAPEYLLGQPLDGRADVFALGVVLYRALTGKRPFLGETEAAISIAVVSDQPRSPLELVPDLNPALAAVVMMALEKDPSKRFESARAFRQALEVAVVHAAENEDVADLMEVLWPPGDEERVALHTLATGMSEERSSPALVSVGSGTYASAVLATPLRPSEPEQLTAQVPRPAPLPLDTSEQPVFEDPAPSRKWMAGLAVVVLVLLAGLGMFFKDRAQSKPVVPPVSSTTGHLSVVTPVVVKVFEDKNELGSSPLELDLPSGSHALRLSNRALGIDQSVVIEVSAGQTASISELAKGTLVVKVEPWAYVKLDGKQLGQTPIPARQVYEGVHVVELNNTNLNENRRVEVKIKAGETRTISVNLEAD
jgi:eukaryotic-like serine/threonine-protein kinase